MRNGELAEAVLARECRPLTEEEIWKAAQKHGLAEQLKPKSGKLPANPAASIRTSLYLDIRQSRPSRFRLVGSRPRRFALTCQEPIEEDPPDEPREQTRGQRDERELHPFLARFFFSEMQGYCKTIHHEKTEGRKRNHAHWEWMHPDMVGLQLQATNWSNEVVDLAKRLGQGIKLFSFEVKWELGFGNLREAFFQAVSNSSWGHEGYLAAANVKNDEEFRSELKRLSHGFGIGIIHLNIVPHPVVWTRFCIMPLMVVGAHFHSAAGLPAAS